MQEQLSIDNTFSVACCKSNLKKVRAYVSQRLSKYALREIEQNQIVLAVEEVCAHRMIHSNDCNEAKMIELTITDQNGNLIFEIFDHGTAFDPSDYQPPTNKDIIDKKRKGGLGLKLVNKIMDKIEYCQNGEGNVCRLFKKIG